MSEKTGDETVKENAAAIAACLLKFLEEIERSYADTEVKKGERTK